MHIDQATSLSIFEIFTSFVHFQTVLDIQNLSKTGLDKFCPLILSKTGFGCPKPNPEICSYLLWNDLEMLNLCHCRLHWPTDSCCFTVHSMWCAWLNEAWPSFQQSVDFVYTRGSVLTVYAVRKISYMAFIITMARACQCIEVAQGPSLCPVQAEKSCMWHNV